MPKNNAFRAGQAAPKHLMPVTCALLVALATGGPAAAQEALLGAAMLRDLPAPASLVEGQIKVFIDFAAILQIDGDVSTIVVGNATIADASVVAAGTIALTGKAVGTTNIVVLRSDGSVLSEMRVQVSAQKPGTVTVRRAILSSSYACTAASCQRSDGGADGGSAPVLTQ